MATYYFGNVHGTRYSSFDKALRPSPTHSAISTSGSITNGLPGNTLQVNQQVTLTYSGQVDPLIDELPSGTYTVYGFVTGGIVLKINGDDAKAIVVSTYAAIGNLSAMTYAPFDVPVCFVKGTLMTTSRGLIAIEDLIAGDTVQGSTGWRTVKWVGWRNYGAASFRTEESTAHIAPVRIRAHAIADNVPSSDLLTSPWHHLFVDGKLVRAGDLVNGTTITQETHVTEVSYYHVELDQFDVVMAHGMYSESWADGGNRNFFQNVDVASLHPEDMKRRRAPRPGFDHLVLRKGKELVAIQSRVAQRAKSIVNIETKAQKAA